MTQTEHPTHRTLVDYLGVVRRRKWVTLVPVLLVPIIAFAYSAQQPKSFGASAEVLLSRDNLGSALSGRTSADIYTDADRFAETQAALARVPEVLRRAVARARTDVSADELFASSSVRPRGNADLLFFNVITGDPESSAALATAYAQSFAQYRLELDTASLASARADLTKSLAQLREEGAGDSALYRQLAQKAQELRTMELLQTKPRVVRTADEGLQVAPTPKRNAILGLGVGLLLGIAAAFLWEALDRRVRDEEEIARTLEIPLLARLPAPRGQGLAMLSDPSAIDAEAVRRLRTNVEFANLDVKARSIMVTSSVSEEGKTTTISNLAIALARGGNRVALVDLDLRKPMVGRLFGLELRPGLADAAIERIELERALVPIKLGAPEPIRLGRPSRRLSVREDQAGSGRSAGEGELFVLPAGFLPSSPGELVGTHAVTGILSWLREQMDFVLIDAPPLLTVSDASTLSKSVDAIIVIVRLGVVNRPMLRDLARELDATPASKLGFVLSGAAPTELYGAGAYGSRARSAPPAERSEFHRVAAEPFDVADELAEQPAAPRPR